MYDDNSLERLLCQSIQIYMSLLLGNLLLDHLLGRLLGCRFLGSWLFSCWLLHLLGRWLFDLLGSRLLGGLGLLGLGLLSLGLLGLWLLGGQFEGSGSLLAGSSSGNHLLGNNHLPQGELHTDGCFGGVHLVVGHHILEDGLAGGSLLVLQPLDGGRDHVGIRGVGGRLGNLLHLGRHDDSSLLSCSFRSPHVLCVDTPCTLR